LPARKTLAQFIALYTDPESHNAQRYTIQTYGQRDGRTDGRHDDANSRLYGAAVG